MTLRVLDLPGLLAAGAIAALAGPLSMKLAGVLPGVPGSLAPSLDDPLAVARLVMPLVSLAILGALTARESSPGLARASITTPDNATKVGKW